MDCTRRVQSKSYAVLEKIATKMEIEIIKAFRESAQNKELIKRVLNIK